MFKSYFNTGFRNILKQKFSATINILGLALALGCCLVVFRFLDWATNMDSLHANRNEIYVVERNAQNNGNEQLWGDSPMPLGEVLSNDFSGIKNMSRMNFVDGVFKEDDKIFRSQVSFVDNSFYKMFDFPVKWGNKDDFIAQDGIVLTEELSEKLYGNINSLGKTVNIRFAQEGKEFNEQFVVKGVLAKKPIEVSFYFEALIPFGRLSSIGINNIHDWKKNVDMTFLQIPDPHVVKAINSAEKKYVSQYNQVNPDTKIKSFYFQPLSSIYSHTFGVNKSRFYYTNEAALIMLAFIAVSLLALVCFNYMNISIASSSSRLKEISLRKMMGGARKQIIFQFLLENAMICVISLILGLILAQTLFLPWFSNMIGLKLDLWLDKNFRVWIALASLVIIATIGGAGYPAFYISGLKPVSIFRGKTKLGSRNVFRKVLLGFQFFLTFMAIATAISFAQQSKKSRERSWGYQPENIVIVPLEIGENPELLKSELLKNPSIEEVSSSVHPLGKWQEELSIKLNGQNQTVNALRVASDFLPLMHIRISKGRNFLLNSVEDRNQSVIVNKSFSRRMRWDNPVGQTIVYDNRTYQIVGEVEDFNYEVLFHPVEPLIIRAAAPAESRFLAAKIKTGTISGATQIIENVWKKYHPSTPFEYYFQKDVFQLYFRGWTQVTDVLVATCLITIFISVSGIFGLASLIVYKRMKEMSIRKVLGAEITSLVFLMNKEFLMTIVVASAVGIPVSLTLIKGLLSLLSPYASPGILPFVIAPLSLVLMTILSMGWHIYKVAISSPSKNLRME